LDEATTIAILSTVIIVAATIIGAVIVADRTESLRSRNEKRDNHLREINDHVLQPMTRQIDKHYLPILRFQNSNLAVNQVPTKKVAAKLTEQPVDFGLEVVIWRPGVNMGVVSPGDLDEKSGYIMDEGLLADCRENHFQGLVGRWDQLVKEMNKYNQNCLDFSNRITKEVASKLKLPIASYWDLPGEFVTPAMGFEIYQRMVAIGYTQLSQVVQSMGYGNVLNVRLGASKVAQLKPDTPPTVIEGVLAEAIDFHTHEAKGIVSIAEVLIPKSESLLKDLVRQEETQKLPGKCSYT
jgi:hypothetical protein